MPYIKKNYPKKNLKKRRGFKVSAGFKTPLGFGANFSLEKRMHNIARREIYKLEGVKIYQSGGEITQTAAHNTGYTMSPTQTLIIGTGDNQRIGQNIFLKKLCFKGLVSNTTTQPTTHWRIMVVEIEPAYAATFSNWTSGIGTSDIFYPTASYTFGMLNHKLGVKVYCDKTYVVKADYTGELKVLPVEFVCNINKRYIYEPISPYFKDKQLYVYAIGYVPGGTTGVTVIGDIRLNGIVTYTN